MNTLKNTTQACRIIILPSRETVVIEPGQMIKVPDRLKSDLTKFFASGYGKGIADRKYILIDSNKDIQVRQKRTDAPPDLKRQVRKGSVETFTDPTKTGKTDGESLEVKAIPTNVETE